MSEIKAVITGIPFRQYHTNVANRIYTRLQEFNDKKFVTRSNKSLAT